MQIIRIGWVICFVLFCSLTSLVAYYFFPQPPSIQLTDSEYLYFYKLKSPHSENNLDGDTEMNISEQSFTLDKMRSLLFESDFQQLSSAANGVVFNEFTNYLISKGYGEYRIVSSQEMRIICDFNQEIERQHFFFISSNPCSMFYKLNQNELQESFWIARE